jgi:hypothetical protein
MLDSRILFWWVASPCFAQKGRAFGIGTPAVLSRNLGESLAQQQAVYTLVNAQENVEKIVGWFFL